jgi:hypothetical protein
MKGVFLRFVFIFLHATRALVVLAPSKEVFNASSQPKTAGLDAGSKVARLAEGQWVS